jgi:TonB family protein
MAIGCSALLACARTHNPPPRTEVPSVPSAPSLNVRKWKFASFFNRMKAEVRKRWQPAAVLQGLDVSANGGRDRYTALQVTLDANGNLVSATVEIPSGVPALDQCAVDAFRAAAPFANPPPALVDKGTISFKFGFYFEVSSASGVPVVEARRRVETRVPALEGHERLVRLAVEAKWVLPPDVAAPGPDTPPTVLRIRATPQGKLTSIEVVQSSGVPGLDDSWRRAVRAAAPFPAVDEDLSTFLEDGLVMAFRPASPVP